MMEFGGLAAFGEHMLKVALEVEVAKQVALEKSCRVIEERAKEKIGEYQDEAGPFVGWAELAEATKEDRARQGYPEDEPLLRTGAMRDSIEHAVGEGEAAVGSNSDVAVYQELGTDRIPPRSFLGGAAVESMPRVLEIVGETAVLALVGEKVHGGKLLIEG